MSVPDYSALVEDAALAFGRPLDSHEACGEFTEFVAPMLHALDANFGHLKKSGAQTQYKGHAADAVLYKATGQAVDLIVGSKAASPENPAKPGWLVDIPRYSAEDWIAPSDAPDPEPEPPPIPAPVPSPPAGPAQPYGVMEAFGLELGDILSQPGSPYVGNLPAACQVAMYLSHVVQFHGWTLEQARENARQRAAA